MSATTLGSARDDQAALRIAAKGRDAGWPLRFATWHAGAAATLLLAVTLWQLAAPGVFLTRWSGAVLLVGSAVTGLPHGMSDFLVAHRLLRPRLGRKWLPVFVGAYLALVLLVVGGWFALPVPTMVLFLLASGFHFGASEMKAGHGLGSTVMLLARGTTPLLPIFLLHPSETGPLIAAMAGVSDRHVIDTLVAARPLLGPWVVIVALATLHGLGSGWSNRRGLLGHAERAELLALSLAAAVAPPLVTFAIYFCLVHAIRHMADLTSGFHPNQSRRAVHLALVVLIPSAMLCLGILAALWSLAPEVTKTMPLVCGTLQLLAALTMPHMVLELFERSEPALILGHPEGRN